MTMIPRVHLNGTSATELLGQNLNAERAVHQALDVLSAAAPNGRDFYPIGDDAFGKARAEHEARCEKLKAVLDEIQEIVQGIDDQTD